MRELRTGRERAVLTRYGREEERIAEIKEFSFPLLGKDFGIRRGEEACSRWRRVQRKKRSLDFRFFAICLSSGGEKRIFGELQKREVLQRGKRKKDLSLEREPGKGDSASDKSPLSSHLEVTILSLT